mgnify:CR=1 FL=1
MEMNKKNSLSNIVLFTMFLPNIIVLFNNKLFSLYTSYSVIYNLFFIAVLIILAPKPYKYKEVFFLIGITLFLMINSFLKTGAYGSALIILEVFLLITVLSKIRLEKRFIKISLLFMILLNIFLFLKSIQYLRAGYVEFNTNQLAMNAYISFIYIVILNNNLKRNKALTFISGILTVISINNYDSRTTLISMLAFIIFVFVIPKRTIIKRKVYRFIYSIIIFMGFLIPYIYVQLWINQFTLRIQFMGKRLFTGREKMWMELYQKVDSLEDLLFGVGSKGIFSNELANAHNIPLHMIMVSGLVICIIYYAVLIRKFEILTKNNFSVSRLGFESLMGFWSMIIYGYFENPIQPNRMLFIFLLLSIFINEITYKSSTIQTNLNKD